MLSLVVMMTMLAGPMDISPETLKLYEERSITFTGGPFKDEVFRYRIMRPANLEPGKKYPLVLSLHGAGERGDDNQKQLMYLPEQLAKPEFREKYPCFVLAPQCRGGRWWSGIGRKAGGDGSQPTDQMQTVEAMLKETLAKEPIDLDRIYLTGLSMGGFGSWDLATRHPEMFACVVPICGGGDTAQAARIAKLPIWAFHGSDDPVVLPKLSRDMIAAIKEAGGNPKYTEFPGVAHNSWTPAYEQADGVLPWMFEQSKSAESSSK